MRGILGKTDPESVTPIQVNPVTEISDLWLLGEHRLLAGSSTDRDDVERLMAGERAALFATDPPYLVDYNDLNHPSKYGESKASKNKDWSETYHEWDSNHGDRRQFYLDFYRIAVDVAISKHAAWNCWRTFVNIVYFRNQVDPTEGFGI